MPVRWGRGITKSIMEDIYAISTADMPWAPNPGPQSDAYRCEADELFYGGQAGGGRRSSVSASLLRRIGIP
jgi:hypothetical protein